MRPCHSRRRPFLSIGRPAQRLSRLLTRQPRICHTIPYQNHTTQHLNTARYCMNDLCTVISMSCMACIPSRISYLTLFSLVRIKGPASALPLGAPSAHPVSKTKSRLLCAAAAHSGVAFRFGSFARCMFSACGPSHRGP